MMKGIFILLLFSSIIAKGQAPTLEVDATTIGSYGTVKFTNPGSLGQKHDLKVDYSEIRGRCYWDNEWNPAVIVLSGGKGVKMPSVKLNFYTNDVHFIDKDGNELITPKGLVRQVVFYSPRDTVKAAAVFQNLTNVASKEQGYYQVLNAGPVELLKRTSVILKKATYDPSVGKDEYRFISYTDYYVRQDKAFSLIKNFNKSSLAAIIKLDEASENWLSTNKNKLKNEDDVIAFLNFLNSTGN